MLAIKLMKHETPNKFYKPDPALHVDAADESHFALMTVSTKHRYNLAFTGCPE